MVVDNQGKSGSHFGSLAILATAMLWLSGCMMVGPDYVRPPAPTADVWIETGDPAVRRETQDIGAWWTVFNDPILNTLVETAYRQNPSLRTAGVRVLEAQARRGIAIGSLFPQQQDAFGEATSNEISKNRANRGAPGLISDFDDWQIGFDATWELDVWGRFRRGIEAADAELLASVASYDDVLVSLVAEVARNYMLLRTLEGQLAVARDNVAIQERSFEIADAKFKGGTVTELDSAQAASLLRDTEAQIPGLESSIRQTQNTLCVLLGIPPQDIQYLLGGAQPIPSPPAEVAVGIPADLLRRRPDIRRTERQLASQSAQIGIAKADLFPSLRCLARSAWLPKILMISLKATAWRTSAVRAFAGRSSTTAAFRTTFACRMRVFRRSLAITRPPSSRRKEKLKTPSPLTWERSAR